MGVSSLTVANGIGALGALLAILTVAYGLFFYRLPVTGSVAVWDVPALLSPLALAMALLSAGVALALGAAAAWWALALLFAVLTVAMGWAGLRRGWDAPLVGRGSQAGRGAQQTASPGAAVQGGLVLTLVTVNLAIVLAWGAVRLTRSAAEPADSLPAVPAAPMVATSVPTDQAAITADATTAPVAAPAPGPTAPPEEGQAVAPAATVAPTLVVLPTATPSAPAAQAPALVVRSAQGVNARRSPDVGAEIVRILADGEELPALGVSADGQWVQATLDDGVQVWVARSFVELNVSVESLPVVPSAP